MMHVKHLIAGMALLAAAALSLAAQTPSAPKDRPAKPPTRTLPPEIREMMGMPPPENPEAVARGDRDFVTNCAFCHGSSATGGEGGPDLVRSVLVLHDEKGSTIGPVILNGRPQKGMPKFPMTQQQIADISSFLHAQAQKTANRMEYKIQNVVTGDAKAGEAYFNGPGKCVSCHSPTGDLAGVAKRFEPVALQSRFLYPKTFRYPGMPNVGPQPKPTQVTVTLPSGQTVTGILKHIDDFNVSLYDSDGEYHSWMREGANAPKVDVHDPLEGHIELLQKYTDADMHNILAYLETLK